MKTREQAPIDVLVVDDSAVARQIMSTLLASVPEFRVSTASDPIVAMAKMNRNRPQVILLDLEMPRMDGLTFLKQLMATDPIPVVVCSGYAEPGTRRALRALEAGAVDIALKPRVSADGTVDDHGLLDIVRAAGQARVGPRAHANGHAALTPSMLRPQRGRAKPEATARTDRGNGEIVVAMGASTGGTEALREVLRTMPYDSPGIVVVQHMPAGFTAAFAEHLNAICQIEVREARSGDRVQPGRALIAPGNRHLLLRRRLSQFVVELTDEAPVCRHRPSVDVLFRSVAQAAGANAVGVIMTGMGSDGAEGLLAMKRAGAATIAQDETTSVVFGMPKEAIDRGAADVVVPLQRIGGQILQRVRRD